MSAATPAEDLLDPRLSRVVVDRSTLAEVMEHADPAASLVVGLRQPDAARSPAPAPSGTDGSLPGSADHTTADLVTLLGELGLAGETLVATHQPSGKAEQLTTILLPPTSRPRRVLVAGLAEGSTGRLRAAGASVGRASRGSRQVVLALRPDLDTSRLAAFVEGFLLGGWGPPRWSAAGPRAGALVADRLTVVVAPDAAGDAESAVTAAVVRVRATVIARCLAVTPSNIKNPAWMAARARTLGRRCGLEVSVWSPRELRRDGFGGLLAVGGGSATPPRLVRLSWEPPSATPTTPHVVLVGKGITFDTGGLQVKPREGMVPMKTDMSGAANVLAVLGACRDLGVTVRVTGLLALAENAFGGGSYRPGDVIAQYGGTSVEIGNTDAEGRIVLADALAYADTQLAPDWLVDIATLTGAARVALAREMAPLYANDEELGAALLEAGELSGETLWRMPLARSYRRVLDSDVADLKHIAPQVGGGSITAALFLQEFVGGRRWAHLDIAGPGRSDVDAGILGKGATAFGTRLLLRWLEGLR